MESIAQSWADMPEPPPGPVAIHTTLYNLITALDGEIGPDEEDLLTATVVHLLNTRRVTCTGHMKGYRLVCGEGEHGAWSGPRELAVCTSTSQRGKV